MDVRKQSGERSETVGDLGLAEGPWDPPDSFVLVLGLYNGGTDFLDHRHCRTKVEDLEDNQVIDVRPETEVEEVDVAFDGVRGAQGEDCAVVLADDGAVGSNDRFCRREIPPVFSLDRAVGVESRLARVIFDASARSSGIGTCNTVTTCVRVPVGLTRAPLSRRSPC